MTQEEIAMYRRQVEEGCAPPNASPTVLRLLDVRGPKTETATDAQRLLDLADKLRKAGLI